MGLEAGSFIPDLDANNPLGSDVKSEGDDHIRLVKRCTQGSFPGFVGTLATPKSVTLTEDEINDAALKSNSQLITGFWDFDNRIRLNNTIKLLGRNAADDANIDLVQIDNSDRTTFGDVNSQQINQCKTQNQFLVDGVTVAFMASLGAGGISVRDLGSVGKKCGFRNPSFNQQNVAYTLAQSDESKIVRKSSGATTDYTVPQLEALTQIIVINDDTNSTLGLLAGAGVTIEAILGGARATAPLTLAPDSVAQLYWVTATLVKVWGNGIS